MSVTIDSGESRRRDDALFTKIDLTAARKWRAHGKYLTHIGCEVGADGVRYWLVADAGARGVFMEFKEASPEWLSGKPAQWRYVERAERALPDQVLRAKQHIIFEHIMTLSMEERRKLMVGCDLVRYDGDNTRYRAHARDKDYNEIHVTEFGSFSGVQRMLREWAVAKGLCYCGSYCRHDDPESFRQFLAKCREHEHA